MIDTSKGIALVKIKSFEIGFPIKDTATLLNVTSSSDNFINSAIFNWSLFNDELVLLASGIVTCSDKDYDAWDNSNESAFKYVIGKVPQVEIA